MKLFQSYTHSGCHFECLIRKSNTVCGCTAWNYPQDPIEVCDHERALCFEQVIDYCSVVTTLGGLLCLPFCLSQRFDISRIQKRVWFYNYEFSTRAKNVVFKYCKITTID